MKDASNQWGWTKNLWLRQTTATKRKKSVKGHWKLFSVFWLMSEWLNIKVWWCKLLTDQPVCGRIIHSFLLLINILLWVLCDAQDTIHIQQSWTKSSMFRSACPPPHSDQCVSCDIKAGWAWKHTQAKVLTGLNNTRWRLLTKRGEITLVTNTALWRTHSKRLFVSRFPGKARTDIKPLEAELLFWWELVQLFL